MMACLKLRFSFVLEDLFMHGKLVFFPVLVIFTACCTTSVSKKEIQKWCTLNTEWHGTLHIHEQVIGLVPVRY